MSTFCMRIVHLVIWCMVTSLIHLGLSKLLAKLVSKSGVIPFSIPRIHKLNLCAANRELQRGVPPPDGQAFSKDVLIRSEHNAATIETKSDKQEFHGLAAVLVL